MNKRAFLLVTGLGLGLVACGDEDEVIDNEEPIVVENPPMPDLPVEEPTVNPPDPDAELPTWDEVKSGHPEGATNPPMPELIVTPDGDCYKHFRPGMIAPQPGEVVGDRIQECGEGVDCGTPVQCPEERKKAVLDAAEPEVMENPPPPLPG